MKELQRVYLELGKKVIVPTTKRTNNEEKVEMKYVTAFILNMQSLGFMPSKDLMDALSSLSYDEFVNIADDIYSQLVQLAGSRTNMIPMYPDFPEVMMSLSDEQLFIDAIVHYFTMGTWEARFQEKIRISTESLLALKTIELGSEEDLMSYTPLLANSSVSMSERQKENLEFLLCRYHDEITIDMFNIVNKENMAFVIETMYNFTGHKELASELAIKHVKTSTDILRIAMAFCEGDYTLSSHKHNLKSLKRSERRFILSLLDKVCQTNNQTIEDASRYQGLWIVIGEILHPGDYATRYPKAYEFFKTIREEKARSWYSKIEKAYESKNLIAIVELLSKRPGEFARRLERTIRHAIDNNENPMDVINAFGRIADKVDSTILLQMSQFFLDKYTRPVNVRTFIPKGSLAKVYAKEDDRAEVSPFYWALTCRTCVDALIKKFSEKEKLGKVYIDPAIKGYAVPLKQRNASKQLYAMARGSRIALPEEAKVLRMYQYWKNPGHTDLDLTAMFVNENFNEVTEDVSYWNLRNKEIDCVHSGDIRSAQNGAAEFIDVPVEKLKEKGVKYVIMTISSYSSIPFCNLEECFAGIMALEEVKPNEKTFDPAKSIVRSDIASDARMCTPFVYDVEKHELVWIDAAVTGHIYDNPINTITYHNNFVNVVRGMMYASYPQLIHLIELNCFARDAEVVDKPEDADVIFSLEEGITPFSVEEINSILL